MHVTYYLARARRPPQQWLLRLQAQYTPQFENAANRMKSHALSPNRYRSKSPMQFILERSEWDYLTINANVSSLCASSLTIAALVLGCSVMVYKCAIVATLLSGHHFTFNQRHFEHLRIMQTLTSEAPFRELVTSPILNFATTTIAISSVLQSHLRVQ